MSGRWPHLERRFDRGVELPGLRASLASVLELVAHDLPGDDELLDLLGSRPDRAEGREPAPASTGEVRLPRIRPVLVALAARAAGAARVDSEAQHAAELLHLALVVHDVALGQRGGRRRRVARKVLTRIGTNQVTLRALELARHASSPELLGEVVDTLREIADAQALSQELRGGQLPTREEWREHADGHLGAVFSFCCRAGGHLGHGGVPTLTALGRYGRHMGRLWHAAEDVAAMSGGEGGAHLVTRALAGRPVLPVIGAAERDPAIARQWASLLVDPRPEVAADLALRVVHAGGIPRSRAVMAKESWSARRALQAIPPSPYRRGMEQIAAGIVRPEAA